MLRRTTGLHSADAQEILRALAQRKKNWVDRRRLTPRADGKTRYAFDEHPSCVLCQRRFMWKEDYQVHKESEVHKDRVRWVEMKEWYNTQGLVMKRRQEEADWAEYVEHVVKPQADHQGRPVAEEAVRHRRGRLMLRDSTGERVDAPTVAVNIVEPRDQRWPTSPRH